MTLPRSPECEHAVIGALLLRPSSWALIEDMRPEHFTGAATRHVYSVMQERRSSGLPIDIVSLRHAIDPAQLPSNISSASWLSAILDEAPTAANIEHHARRVIDLWRLRQIVTAAGKATADAQLAACANEVLQPLQASLLALQSESALLGPEHVRIIISRVYREMEAIRDGGRSTSLPFGWPALDAMAVMDYGDLVIVAGRPSMGKTAFGLNAALAAASGGARVLIFSCEMTKEALTRRLVSLLSGLTYRTLQRGRLTEQQDIELVRASGRISALGIEIEDRSNTLMAVETHVRRAAAKTGVDLVMIDYLQLLRGDAGTKAFRRNEELGNITSGLKRLALDIQCPVMAICQVSRAAEQRKSSRPTMADLYDSGRIEQDADLVIFPYRPEYYNIREIDHCGVKIATDGLAEIIIGKYRNGPTGSVLLRWSREVMRFSEWEAPPEQTIRRPDQSAWHEEEEERWSI